MPSIPQSLLWISLVVLWLFVLVPMLISKRDAVRRTSDVALATRVLNTTTSSRLLKRGGPASGHRSDPDWRPSEDDLDETFDDDDFDDDYEDEEDDESEKTVVLAAPVVEVAEPEYLDVDVIEEPVGALPVGASAEQELAESDEMTLNFEEPDEVDEVDEAVEVVEVQESEEENVDTAIYEVATDEYEERRGRRYRRRVRVRRRLVGPRGACGNRSADRGLDGGLPAASLRPGEGRGDQRPQVQVPQADAGVHDADDDGVGGLRVLPGAVGLVRVRRRPAR